MWRRMTSLSSWKIIAQNFFTTSLFIFYFLLLYQVGKLSPRFFHNLPFYYNTLQAPTECQKQTRGCGLPFWSCKTNVSRLHFDFPPFWRKSSFTTSPTIILFRAGWVIALIVLGCLFVFCACGACAAKAKYVAPFNCENLWEGVILFIVQVQILIFMLYKGKRTKVQNLRHKTQESTRLHFHLFLWFL